MTVIGKKAPLEAAQQFIEKYYPDCAAALLAGSAVREEATATSDLDIVVFDSAAANSYRDSVVEFDWPIEVFVHNLASYRPYFQNDVERARPSLPNMVAEGIVVRDTGVVHRIKCEAQELLDAGPAVWSAATIRTKRYFLTDALDDFIGCCDRAEGIFIAGALAEALAEFELRTQRRWVGASKWIVRALQQYDTDFAGRFVAAFEDYYRHDNKKGVIELADAVLEPHGGRLFEGFSLGRI